MSKPSLMQLSRYAAQARRELDAKLALGRTPELEQQDVELREELINRMKAEGRYEVPRS